MDEPTVTEAENPGEAGAARDAGITFRITRRVRAGREAEYEKLLADMTRMTEDFPGYVSGRTFGPVRGNREYRTVLRFQSEQDVHRWKESKDRQAWLAQIDELTDEPARYANITGTGQDRPLVLALTPLESFVKTSVSGIGLLLLGTVLALIAANSPLAGRYADFWAFELTIGAPDFGITESLQHWVNDGLMALFFFIVGLEIKREVLVGEMRNPRQAALPIAAAIGGAIIPALVYLIFNRGGGGSNGWGVAMATDTAFSLGIVSLLGTRVRPLLLVFLTAFAIVDDIIAVLVIAVFYTDTIAWGWLGAAALLLGALAVANRAGFHRWPVYAFLGLAVWLAVFESGVHGTFAGVLVALLVPARSWINPSEFLVRGRQLIADFEAACYLTDNMLSNEPQQQATQALERLCEEVETPMTHFQHSLNSWVAFGILPIFAFANAGIPIVSGFGAAMVSPVTWGVIFGLVVGKPLGILLFAWIAVRSGIALLPRAISWRHVGGVALLGGIGFTISLFVAELAFERGALADEARIGILLASVIAGALGYLVLREVLPPPREEPA